MAAGRIVSNPPIRRFTDTNRTRDLWATLWTSHRPSVGRPGPYLFGYLQLIGPANEYPSVPALLVAP